MYVALNYRTKTFTNLAHSSLTTLCDLALTEAPKEPLHIENVTWPFLGTWRDIDLVLLYRNTTGEQATRIGDDLRALLMEIASRVPECKVNALAAAQRAEMVEVSGKPVKEIMVVGPIAVPKASDQAAVLAAPRVRPVVAEPVRPAVTVQTRERAAPGAPRSGGVRETIWAVADKLWQEAGSPKEIAAILPLRKTIMAVLEAEHSVKKTTSSNELGNWQKAKLSL